ncbi:uncharacterized protein LOC112453730 [Temnothorax curvispinosus]|uniref:Uncharacterized protein LOC112453730 n=1 Tax=Temnothorax curvispinosus TaxID=300111 RepID=A0A6J1PL79_9HYME|nr:uncharacterized protein LOC112453730 [Temnothorax curvispinosus]
MASAKKKGPKKVYERFKYTEKDMEEALKAARSGICQSPPQQQHIMFQNQHCMADTLAKFLISVSWDPSRYLGKAQVGFPMHPDEVKDAVQRVIEECPLSTENPFKNNRPVEKWMDLFLKKHPEIRKKNTEIISKARASPKKDYDSGLLKREPFWKKTMCLIFLTIEI